MIENIKTGAVIPCYMGGESTIKMISKVIKYVDILVLIDDCCPLKTGIKLSKQKLSSKVNVIYNEKNIGVGGSTKKGFDFLLNLDCEIIVKIDADNQMNPDDIPKMISPIMNNECEATKGNRFTNIENLLKMPKTRLVGNTFLSYITKMSTGYWELFDPTNGFIAFKSSALKKINLKKIDNYFFFETDMLFRCSLNNITIKNIDVDIIYDNIYSSLNPYKELPNFLIKSIKLTIKRIIYQYYIIDFNPGSIELLLSLITAVVAILIGIYSFFNSYINNSIASAGTASLFTIFTIISLQLFLSFIYFDCSSRVILRALK